MDFYSDTSAVNFWVAGLLLLGVFFVLILSRSQFQLRSEVYRVAGVMPANQHRRFRLYVTAVVLLAATALLSAFDFRFVKRDGDVTPENTDILFVIDISNSMKVRDMDGSRLDAAKRAVRQLVDINDHARFGIVLFSGAPLYYSPFTSDKKGFLEFLDAASPDMIQPNGTDFIGVHHVVKQALASDPPRKRFVVFLSDGENHSELPEDPWLNNKNEVIPALILGIGTETGGELQFGRRRVRSKFQPDTLEEFAGIVNGKYMPLKTDGAWLLALGQKISNLANAPGQAKERDWYSLQHIYAAIILLLFCIQIFLRRPILPKGAAG